MKTLLATAFLTFAIPAVAAERLRTDPSTGGESRYPYQSSTGMQYQYDLSRPPDQIRYGIDPRAQIRDSISVDPRRDLDRSMGQVGGGAKR